MLVDYHVHTDNSFDCHISMADMCASALSKGCAEVAFTDHFNHHLLDFDVGYYDPERFFADIEDCRAQYPTLTIRAGIEVGEPHRWHKRVQPTLERYPYDVVLGSLHWVGNESMFAVTSFKDRPPREVYHNYFAELTRMIEHGGFDILAHIDLPKRVGFDVYGSYDAAAYEDDLRMVWQACLDHEITPEINTKGLRCSVKQLHPTVEALRWYTEMGGEWLTLGSDAHHANSIGAGFDEARECALAVGITRTCQYEGRAIKSWQDL